MSAASDTGDKCLISLRALASLVFNGTLTASILAHDLRAVGRLL